MSLDIHYFAHIGCLGTIRILLLLSAGAQMTPTKVPEEEIIGGAKLENSPTHQIQISWVLQMEKGRVSKSVGIYESSLVSRQESKQATFHLRVTSRGPRKPKIKPLPFSK